MGLPAYRKIKEGYPQTHPTTTIGRKTEPKIGYTKERHWSTAKTEEAEREGGATRLDDEEGKNYVKNLQVRKKERDTHDSTLSILNRMSQILYH